MSSSPRISIAFKMCKFKIGFCRLSFCRFVVAFSCRCKKMPEQTLIQDNSVAQMPYNKEK